MRTGIQECDRVGLGLPLDAKARTRRRGSGMAVVVADDKRDGAENRGGDYQGGDASKTHEAETSEDGAKAGRIEAARDRAGAGRRHGERRAEAEAPANALILKTNPGRRPMGGDHRLDSPRLSQAKASEPVKMGEGGSARSAHAKRTMEDDAVSR